MSTSDSKTENKTEIQTENIIDNATGEPSETAAKPAIANTPDKKPSVSLWINLTIYISSVFFPIIGIAMGFTYMRKEDPEMRKAGRNWLILGVFVLLIYIALVSTIKKAETGF